MIRCYILFLVIFLSIRCSKDTKLVQNTNDSTALDDSGSDWSPDPDSGSIWSHDSTYLNVYKLLSIINLDYPGLEQAKSYYKKEDYNKAVEALLNYYRKRTGIEDPTISLNNVIPTSGDISKADYALDHYRFYVNNYYEDPSTNEPYSVEKDGKIDWGFEPAGADNEYQYQLNRLQWMVPQAKVYYATKDQKYIESYIYVYNDWLRKHPIPKNGPEKPAWRQLEAAQRLFEMPKLFAYYKNSKKITASFFARFMYNLAQTANFLVKYPSASGNMLVSECQALVFAGVLFPEFKKAANWRNTGYETLGNQVEKQFLKDGMHEELDLSYHIGAIADYYKAIELAKANPQIVNNLSSIFDMDRLHKAARVVMNFTFPNYFQGDTKDYKYFVPGFNDTRQSSWTRNVLNKNFKRYHEMFPNDNHIEYIATYGQNGIKPSTDPVVMKKSGYYVLRNGWDKSSTMFIMSDNYSTKPFHYSSHNQPDNGTFELYINGRDFFPDAGVYTYSGDDNTDRKWFRQTRVHNTMTLDHQNITTGEGQFLKLKTNNEYEAISVENKGYNNLKERRTVFFVDHKFFVIVDEAIGTRRGTVNLNFNLCRGNDNEVVLDLSKNGAHTDFSDNNNIVIRTFGNGSKNLTSKSFSGQVSFTPHIKYDRKAYTVNQEKTNADAAQFITVIYPCKNAGTQQINAEFNQPFSNSGVEVQVEINNKVYNLNLNL